MGGFEWIRARNYSDLVNKVVKEVGRKGNIASGRDLVSTKRRERKNVRG